MYLRLTHTQPYTILFIFLSLYIIILWYFKSNTIHMIYNLLLFLRNEMDF